jgi:hypothetical protein
MKCWYIILLLLLVTSMATQEPKPLSQPVPSDQAKKVGRLKKPNKSCVNS